MTSNEYKIIFNNLMTDIKKLRNTLIDDIRILIKDVDDKIIFRINDIQYIIKENNNIYCYFVDNNSVDDSTENLFSMEISQLSMEILLNIHEIITNIESSQGNKKSLTLEASSDTLTLKHVKEV